MEKIIVMTPEELRTIIEDILAPYGEKIVKPEKPERPLAEHITFEEALLILKEGGFPTSKSKMYRLTSQGKIPHLKYGNKIIFSRKELMNWVMGKTIDKSDHTDDIVEFTAQARKKSS